MQIIYQAVTSSWTCVDFFTVYGVDQNAVASWSIIKSVAY